MGLTNMCACCGGADYKKCQCPWNTPFERWPTGLLDKLKKATAGGPHQGS